MARGYHGEMAYLERTAETRLNPATLLPGVRSIVCVGLLYKRTDGYQPLVGSRDSTRAAPEATDATARAVGRVAQYARGVDYHVVLHRMLRQLALRLTAALNDERWAWRACVDSAPVFERELAARAGLGWIGRNTCLLNADLGSYILLGELLTTLELAEDEPVTERCARCTRCIDACPTQALRAPYELDARRCIAYLTIEHRSAIPNELQRLMGAWVFGCDVCQQVCPHNHGAPLGTHPDLSANLIPPEIPLESLVTLTSGGYRRLTRGTAARRACLSMWQRNAAVAARNAASRPDAPRTDSA